MNRPLCLSVVFSVIAAAILSGCSGAPVQLCLRDPIQLYDSKTDVDGVRLTLAWGRNTRVTGLDLGLGMLESDRMSGVRLGGLCFVHFMDGAQVTLLANSCTPTEVVEGSGIMSISRYDSCANGLQATGLWNDACRLNGVQLTLFSNSADRLNGMQVAGLMNGAVRVNGVQLAGLLNRAADDMVGVQIALFYNDCSGNERVIASMRGLQIGLVNFVQRGNAVQIGLINIAPNQVIPVLPLIHPGLWPKNGE